MIKLAVVTSAACCVLILSKQLAAAPARVDAGVPHQSELRSDLLSQHSIDLSLAEAVSLGLRRNYSIRSLKLQRLREKFDLLVADDLFNPKLKLSGTHRLSRGSVDSSRSTGITPKVSLLGEYGTNIDLSWNQQLNATKNSGDMSSDGLGLTLTQPLLRGAGKEVTTEPLRLAKLTEQVNQLNVKASVSKTVYDIIAAYRTLMKSQTQVTLAMEALGRAVSLLNINKQLIGAGRVAEFDVVQIEADIATQELAVEEAKNQLAASRLVMLKLLALDLETPVRASDTLQVTRLDIDQATALKVAQARQPQYLATLLQSEQASINLLVAQDRGRWDVSLVSLGAPQSTAGEAGGLHRGVLLATGQQLIKLGNMKGLKVVTQVAESDVNKFVLNQDVAIAGDGFSGRQLSGYVSAISQLAVQDDNAGSAARFPVTITVNAPEDGDFKNVRLGMSVHMTIVTYRNENSFIIPHAAVEQAGDAMFVEHRENLDAPVVRREVTIGQSTAQGVEVFGLNSGFVSVRSL